MSAPLWHYEDYELGYSGTTGGRTITDADIVNFSGVSGDFNPMHVDDEQARAEGPFGGRIAQGLLGTSAMTGLLCRDAPEILGTRVAGIAFLGLNWRFRAPILVGDTIRAAYRVASKRPTSGGESGVIEYEVDVLKHDGTVAQSGTLSLLLRRRDGQEAPHGRDQSGKVPT